jgi:hypothetical protein
LLAGESIHILGRVSDIAFHVSFLEHDLLLPPPIGTRIIRKVAEVMVASIQIGCADENILTCVVGILVVELNRGIHAAILAIA